MAPHVPRDTKDIFIDGQILLMQSRIDNMTTWRELALGVFGRRVSSAHRMFDNVILAFDNYRCTPVFKSIEQAKRVKQANPFPFQVLLRFMSMLWYYFLHRCRTYFHIQSLRCEAISYGARLGYENTCGRSKTCFLSMLDSMPISEKNRRGKASATSSRIQRYGQAPCKTACSRRMSSAWWLAFC